MNRRSAGLGRSGLCGLAFLAAMAIALCAACSGQPPQAAAGMDPAAANPADASAFVEAALPASLRQPSGVAVRIPPQSSLTFPNGRYYYGAFAAQQGLTGHVNAALDAAVFAPDWRNGAGEAAYTIFGCNLEGYTGKVTISLEWASGAPPAGKVFTGWGNRVTNAWDWSVPGKQRAGGLAPYLDADNHALLAIVVLGDAPAWLGGVKIGDSIIRNGVDVTRLFAPALEFEVDAANAELANRNPVERDFQIIKVYKDGAMTMAVVSHTVDGLTQYGSLRIPPDSGAAENPIMLLCHGGVAGAEINGLDWLAPVVDDYALLNRFLIVMPVFRGETLGSGALAFTAQGGKNIYDHDTDDALALLDCALNHFPQGDSGRIVAAGWSRGAQVALRAAARDARITGAIGFAAWTDEWSPPGQEYACNLLAALDAEPMDAADARQAYNHQLWQLKTGAANVWDMRRLMLNMSVAYSASDLPAVQLHYGALDETIPICHAQSLAAWLGWCGHRDYQYYVYPEGTHYPPTYTGAGPRVREMLREYAE